MSPQLPPQPPPFFATPLNPPDFVVDEKLAEAGALLYGRCRACHGRDALAGGMAPDLRASPIPLDLGAFAGVVRDGVRAARAMPTFPDITDDQLRALQHYLRQAARKPPPTATAAPH